MRIQVPQGTVTLRCAGICIHEGKVLMHRSEHDDFLTVPGGGIEFGESANEALQREMLEELSASIRLLDTQFVIENHFEYNGSRLYFRWVPLADLSHFEVRPEILKRHLPRLPSPDKLLSVGFPT